MRGTGSVVLYKRHRECGVILVAWGVCCYLSCTGSMLLYEWHREHGAI